MISPMRQMHDVQVAHPLGTCVWKAQGASLEGVSSKKELCTSLIHRILFGRSHWRCAETGDVKCLHEALTDEQNPNVCT